MESEENQKPVSHRFPQPLEIANDAIPTFPQPRRGAEKWKTKTQVPTFPLVVYFSRKGDQAVASLRFRLIVRLENAEWVTLMLLASRNIETVRKLRIRTDPLPVWQDVVSSEAWKSLLCMADQKQNSTRSVQAVAMAR